MKWIDLPEKVLLQRSFLVGIVGIVLGALSIINSQLDILNAPMGPLNGVSFFLQLFALGLAVVVMRKRKVNKEHLEKAKVLTLVLAVSLLFFVLSI